MKTRPKPRQTPEQRRARVNDLRDRLALWQGTSDPEMVAMVISMFDGYSARNAQLIAMQRPEATDVRGFREWLDHGRVVRKGEHGIGILAPVTRKRSDDRDDDAGEDTRRIVNVRLAYVFDVAQTDELPDPS